MEPAEYRKMFELENRLWWFVGKRRIAMRLLMPWLSGPERARILDAGCGTGGALAELGGYGEAFGTDSSPEALPLARRRGLDRLAYGSVEALPFRDGAFDLVTLFDVLYHRGVGDVARALAEAARVTRPGGLLYVNDSAFAFLRSRHDAAMHGARRFTSERVGELVRAAGYRVLRLSYANMCLFPVVVLWRWLGRGGAGGNHLSSDVRPLPGPLNALLAAVLALEAWLIGSVRLPVGSSVVCLAQKETST